MSLKLMSSKFMSLGFMGKVGASTHKLINFEL